MAKYQNQYLISAELIHHLETELILSKVAKDLMLVTLKNVPFLFEDVKLCWQFELIIGVRCMAKVQPLDGFKLLYEELNDNALIQGYKGIPTIKALKYLPYAPEVRLILTVVKDE